MSNSLLTRLRRGLAQLGQRLGWAAVPKVQAAAEVAPAATAPAQAFEVVVAATAWTVTGVNVFSANLVRGLHQAGVTAHVLLTEHDTALVNPNEASMPRPAGVNFQVLPVGRRAGWGAHWGAMLRWLEESAPCVYIPNSDWRHSCVCPQLPDHVVVVGVVHSDDPLHYDHVRRLGRYWNVIVTVSRALAQRTAELCPELAERIVTIPIGVRIPEQRPVRAAADGVLRLIYHGILKQHQKRVLDLPKIVQRALELGVPVQLSIAGAGPDEAALRTACADLVDRGAIRFLGVTSPDDIAALLERHDVYLLASEFEGMPNALIEAMGRGCVPVVSRMASGIPELIRDGDNGFMVAIGDADAFAERLQVLWTDPARRERMSISAFATVQGGGFRVEDMVAAYRRVFDQAWERVRTGAFVRPRGPLLPPPAAVAGVNLLPIAYTHSEPELGAFPSVDDAEDYYVQIAATTQALGSQRRQRRDSALAQVALDGIPVFVAAPVWTGNGVNRWSEDLVRGLRAAGLDARILLTEESTDRVTIDGPRMARPTDIPFQTLTVRGRDSWGGRWGAMVRTLEAAAPCFYFPTYDWRHSCVVPALSARVKVVGTVHDTGPLYADHAARLARYWDALIATSHAIARSIRRELPASAARLGIIAPGLDFPATRAERPPLADAVASILVIAIDLSPERGEWLLQSLRAIVRTVPQSRIVVVDPPQSCQHALKSLGARLLINANRQQWLALSRSSDFVVAADGNPEARRLWLEAIGNGCVPVGFGLAPAHALAVELGIGGSAADLESSADEVRALVANPGAHSEIATRAHGRVCALATRSEQMIEGYLALFRRLMLDAEFNPFSRTPAPIQPPPASVSGQSIFPFPLRATRAYGRFPSAGDARNYRDELRR